LRRQVELLEKNKPQQERAKRTYDAILVAAAELLVEVGVERISTNLVAERAGITVPALYRYFPNKYAVLHALGAKLMDRQNEWFDTWLQGRVADGGLFAILDNLEDMLRNIYEITRTQTGGIEIVHALRAVGPLQVVRLESHQLITDGLTETLAEQLGRETADAFRTQTRIAVEVGYSVVEMALEDPTLPVDDVLREGARIIRVYWQGALSELLADGPGPGH